MKLPDNTGLPFFAYGIFKPGQIAHFRIKDLVERAKESEISGSLKERDGVPLLIIGQDMMHVQGSLITFKSGCEVDAYRRINQIEPSDIYRWQEVILCDNSRANVLIGRKVGRGSSDFEYNVWDGRNDPLFNQALEIVATICKENSKFDWNYKPLLNLQMGYFLLWMSIERYASLRYHLGSDVQYKINQIANESSFANGLKKYVHRKYAEEIFDTRNPETKIKLNPEDPSSSLRYYYQVRSNSVHRGKTVPRDFNILCNSLRELLSIYKDMLQEAFSRNDRLNSISPMAKSDEEG